MKADQDPGEADGLRFFRDIEDHFVRLRGAPLVLSPDDWHLVALWRQQGIPLRVILRGITCVFEKPASRSRRVNSLSYCRQAVEKEYAEHLAAAAGAPERVPGTAGPARQSRLQERAAALRAGSSSWPDGARRLGLEAAAILEHHAARPNASGGRAADEEEENRLRQMEESLLEALEHSLTGAQREALDETCRRRMQPYRQRMSADVFARTLRHSFEAELRRHFHLPRLTLLLD